MRLIIVHSFAFGFGLAVIVTTLAVGNGGQPWLAAYAGLLTALVSEIASWLWRAFNRPPRKRRAGVRYAQARRSVQQTQKFPPPLYAARVSDLRPTEYVRVRCECGRAEILTAAMLSRSGVSPKQKLTDLGRGMRCRQCEARGCALVSITRGRLAIA